MLDIYKNIAARRKQLGMTQRELSDLLGYKSASSIADIENGKVDLPVSRVISFAKALNTTVPDLFGWTSSKP